MTWVLIWVPKRGAGAKVAIHLLDLNAIKKTKPGMYADGGNLYLQVTLGKKRNVRRSWIFRYALNGRTRDMGLGSLHTYTLEDARERARACRKLVDDGVDPIDYRDIDRAEKARATAAREAAAAAVVTFDQAAADYIAVHRPTWKNPVHADQWETSIETYASPHIGKINVRDIDTAHVLKVLRPIWNTKTETAKRLRGRIEAILDAAKVAGHREKHSENPARWRGHLDKLLARPSKLRKVKNHPALPYPEIGAFIAELRASEGIGALALEFTILTAARSSETFGATWNEFDLSAKVWTLSAERMKADEPHRVPLSSAAVAVLRKVRALTAAIGGDVAESEFVFPNDRTGEMLSENAMLAVLARMGRHDITVHGFRSTFRDWAAEITRYENHVVEKALAHKIENETERAYRRGDLLGKRVPLMADWAKYCALARPAGKVVPMNRPAPAIAR